MTTYKVNTYIVGTLVKQFKIDAVSYDYAIEKANRLAMRDWETGNTDGWDITLDSEVDEDATEVVG